MAVAYGVAVTPKQTSTGCPMIRCAFVRFSSVFVAAVIVSSCSDASFRSPTGPADALPSHAVNAAEKGHDGNSGISSTVDKLELSALWWDNKAKGPIQVSKTIDASGGVISMPATGLTIVFPEGAVIAPIRITVTADDKYVAYKMEPSGTKFLKDVTVTQLLGVTKLSDSPLRSQLFAAYIADDRLKLSGKVSVIEIEPSYTVFSSRTGRPEAQVWVIRHFSRYMLASG